MKVLFVGLGGIGQRHARNLRGILGPEAEFLAYRVRKLTHVITPQLQADTSMTVEKEFSIRTFDSLDCALAEKPNIAFVTNPSRFHVPIALACVEAGCDLFIEKPLSDSLADVDTLIQAAEEKRRVTMVGYQLRFHPCLARLRELLQAGAIGQPLAVRAHVGEYIPNWHRYEDYRTMYAARRDLGGGVILSQIHEFDYLYSLFGFPKAVFGLGGHWSSLEVDVEDTASILLENQLKGRPLPVHVQLDYLQSPPSRQCEVVGEHGKIVMDLVALTVSLYHREHAQPQVTSFSGFERNQLFTDELRHFLHCVDTRQQPMVNLRDGAQSLKMALAAKESIETGEVVQLQ